VKSFIMTRMGNELHQGHIEHPPQSAPGFLDSQNTLIFSPWARRGDAPGIFPASLPSRPASKGRSECGKPLAPTHRPDRPLTEGNPGRPRQIVAGASCRERAARGRQRGSTGPPWIGQIDPRGPRRSRRVARRSQNAPASARRSIGPTHQNNLGTALATLGEREISTAPRS
jgi:hypothetical protein